MSAGRKLIPRILLIGFLQIIAIFALLELGIRVVKQYHRPTSILLYDSMAETRYHEDDTLEELLNRHFNGYRPFTEDRGFVLNSKSFRTKEYTRNKSPDTYRIVALGDSFTYASGGVPYADLWPTKLERVLAEKGSQRVEVLNLGWPGVGPKFQVRLWELEAGHLDADLVIFAFFVGNDFVEDSRPRLLTERGILEESLVVRAIRNLYRLRGGAVENAPPVVVSPVKGVDQNGNSSTPRGGYEIEGYRQLYDSKRPTFAKRILVEVEARRMALCLRADIARFEQLFEGTAHTLLTLRDKVVQSGARFKVMIIPDEYQVNPDVVAAVLERTGHSAADYDPSLPQDRLTKFFDEVGIEYIDLLPAFIEAGEHEALYMPRNTHWNRRGNSLAVALLVDHLSWTPL